MSLIFKKRMRLRMLGFCLRTGLSFSLVLLSHASIAGEIHVAVSGSDQNDGSATAPLATIEAARNALRSLGKLGEEPCTVVVHAGTYRLTKPLIFEPQDGGSEQSPVVYQSAAGDVVWITGAQRVTTQWIARKDGVFRTKIGPSDAIDQLFASLGCLSNQHHSKQSDALRPRLGN